MILYLVQLKSNCLLSCLGTRLTDAAAWSDGISMRRQTHSHAGVGNSLMFSRAFQSKEMSSKSVKEKAS